MHFAKTLILSTFCAQKVTGPAATSALRPTSHVPKQGATSRFCPHLCPRLRRPNGARSSPESAPLEAIVCGKTPRSSCGRQPRLGRRTKRMVPAPCAQSLSPAADLLATTCAKDPCKLSVQFCKNCVKPHQLALGDPQTSVNSQRNRRPTPCRPRGYAGAKLLPLFCRSMLAAYVGCLHLHLRLRLHLRLWLYACCSALQRRTYSYRRPIGRYWAVARRASAKVPRGLRLCSGSGLCSCL